MNKKIIFLVLLFGVLFLPLWVHGDTGDKFCGFVSNIEALTWWIGGSLVVIGWVIAGILYLTSAGSPEKTNIARKALIAAIIGTVLVVLASTSADIIKDALGGGDIDKC